jgi:hypothetical protein
VTSATRVPAIGRLAAVIRGDEVSWRSFGATPDELLEMCHEHDVVGLLHQSLTDAQRNRDWPKEFREDLARRARVDAAREMLRRREILAALNALAARNVFPILLKGTPLAYGVYPEPALRPRTDTDLLVRHEQIDLVRDAMSGLGYLPTPYCEGELLFCQFEMRKDDAFGVDHAFDVHWKISTQSLFKELLTYDELAAEAQPVPALGPHARTPGPLHALLVACVHPVMHHRNIERLIWVHDIHLLASRLGDSDLDRFADLAIAKHVAALCAHGLATTRKRFPSANLDRTIARLAASRQTESSAAYLCPDRRWHHELIANLRGLPRWRDRLQLLREVALPAPGYMLNAYEGPVCEPGAALLPMLYIHRLVRGVWKIAVGRK